MVPSTSRPEPYLPPDLQNLAWCRILLQRCEYQIFEAAYRSWYGRQPSEADLKPAFGGYLRGRGLPHWVRHYCRQVVTEAESQGRLRPGGHEEPTAELRLARILAIAALVLTMALLA